MKKSTRQSVARVATIGIVAAGTLLLPSCKFNNCSTMWRTWPHGVGNANAVDRTSGTPRVSNFFRNGVEYSNNSNLDRDRDGIACERL